MAFMMPVMKNEWDIYQSGRSRRSSECSNPRSCRSRGASESKSEGPSLSTSPASVGDFHMASSPHRLHHLMAASGQQHRHLQLHSRQRRSSSSRGLSRASSSQRASQSSLPSPPNKSPDDDDDDDEELDSNAASPPKTGSQSSLNRFHARVLDKLKRSLKGKSSEKNTVAAPHGLPPPAS